MERITGVIRHYPWGDERFIPDLTGQTADGRPWAELWLGTHPDGPSILDDGRLLAEVSGNLPYLMKVLAAAEPLSLQAHPDAVRSREGHAEGRYPDPHPKPELLCALTPFDALCGIRPTDATVELLGSIGDESLTRAVADDGVATTLDALYRGRLDPAPTIAACSRSSRPEAELVTMLAGRYPGDPSVAATLLLNRVRLAPGEAIFLPAGNLHAYLGGAGVEVMGASDNVVRGGLTAKHVDVDELLRIVDPTPLPDPVVHPVEDGPGRFRYEPPGTAGAATAGDPLPFGVRRLETDGTSEHVHVASSHDLLVCTAGGDHAWPRGVAVHAAPGETVALPSDSTVYVATAPLAHAAETPSTQR